MTEVKHSMAEAVFWKGCFRVCCQKWRWGRADSPSSAEQSQAFSHKSTSHLDKAGFRNLNCCTYFCKQWGFLNLDCSFGEKKNTKIQTKITFNCWVGCCVMSSECPLFASAFLPSPHLELQETNFLLPYFCVDCTFLFQILCWFGWDNVIQSLSKG